MEVKIELDELLDHIVIKCKTDDDNIKNIVKHINSLYKSNIIFYKKDIEYYLDVNQILFFETNGSSISAHTINDVYNVKYKLYELEDILPSNFIRVSKSSIANISHIHSIDKNITYPSLIKFDKSHKQVYVSRLYNKSLKHKLRERV